MTILKAVCDDCGKEIKGDEVFMDYDNVHRCHICDIKSKILYAQQDYNDKKRWLEDTHLKDLRVKKNKVEHLEAELNALIS